MLNQPTLQELRTIVAQTQKHKGTKRGIHLDKKGLLIGAWAEVLRSDWDAVARVDLRLGEYREATPEWESKPARMIQEAAELEALRMAFALELSGSPLDESSQASPPPADVSNQAPPAAASEAGEDWAKADFETPAKSSTDVKSDADMVAELGAYKVEYGKKYFSKRLDEIRPGDLAQYLDWLESEAHKKGEALEGKAAELVWTADQYLKALKRLEDVKANALATAPNVAPNLINKHKGKSK